MTVPPGFASLSAAEQQRVRTVLRETNNLAYSYAAMLLIAAPPSVGGVVNQGSGIVMRLGENHFFLTAEHVVRKWYERYRGDQSVRLHLAAPNGAAHFTAEDRLVFVDREADIAALRVTASEARSVGTYVYVPHGWPPPAPTVGEMVYIAGFPLEGRITLSPKRFELRAFNLGTPVSAVADKNFKCLFDRAEWISGSDITIEAAPSLLDGTSGGPVFAMRGLIPVLVGTVSEHQPTLDILIAGRWSHIPASSFEGA
jgi:S1-C subfamily serine protease